MKYNMKILNMKKYEEIYLYIYDFQYPLSHDI